MPITMIRFSKMLAEWFGQSRYLVYGGWIFGMSCLADEQNASDRFQAFLDGYRAGGANGDYLLRSILHAYEGIAQNKPDREERVRAVKELFRLRKRVEFNLNAPFTFQELDRVLVQIEGSEGYLPGTLLMKEDFVKVLGLVMRRVNQRP